MIWVYRSIIAAVVFSVCTWLVYEPPPHNPNTHSQSTVMITSGQGHGSAVHIGGGYFVTAAHVTSGAKEMKFFTRNDGQCVKTTKTDDGKVEETHLCNAEVLWENKTYDLALMRNKDYINLPMAELDCRTAVVGEMLEFSGNPRYVKNASTWGRVSSDVMQVEGTWKVALPVDASLAPGMSGGGVYDDDGDMVGVNVGGMLSPVGFGASYVGISFIVPSSVVCDLLAVNR